MAINLVKGQKIDLTKGNAGLNKIMVGLGWDPVNSGKGLFGGLFGGGNKDIDCDASAILLGADDKLLSNKDVIYFGNLTHATKSVKHMGDNLTGDGDGDDEQIFIELNSVPAQIEKIGIQKQKINPTTKMNCPLSIMLCRREPPDRVSWMIFSDRSTL